MATEKARADGLQKELDELKSTARRPPLPSPQPPPEDHRRPALGPISGNKREHATEDTDEDKRTLTILWSEEGGSAQAPCGEAVPGRRRISGRQKILNKAEKSLTRSQQITNPSAESLNLGPCLHDNEAMTARGGRPIACFEILSRSGQGSNKRNRTAMLYHVTWCAAHDRPPPKGLEYSHRCHDRACVAPKHGVWESALSNRERNSCRGGQLCPHSPICFPIA